MLVFPHADVADGRGHCQGRNAVFPSVALLQESRLREDEAGMTGRKAVGGAVRPLAPACPVERDAKTRVENLVGSGVSQPLLFTLDVVFRIRNAESHQRKESCGDVACTQRLGVGRPRRCAMQPEHRQDGGGK
jgi:hypothetical protein